MGTAQRVVLGGAAALLAITVMVGFMFAFVLAPLITAAFFLLVFIVLQVFKR